MSPEEPAGRFTLAFSIRGLTGWPAGPPRTSTFPLLYYRLLEGEWLNREVPDYYEDVEMGLLIDHDRTSATVIASTPKFRRIHRPPRS